MRNISNVGFVAVAIAVGCAMTPTGARNNPEPGQGSAISAVRELLRCRSEIRRIECLQRWVRSGEHPADVPVSPAFFRT